MPAFEQVDITSQAFSLRLANLLVATRTRNGLGVGAMAKASSGRFSRSELKEYERGSRQLDERVIDELAQLYSCDLGLILPLRLPVVVSANRVSAGGVHQEIEGQGADATLAAYLTLVRSLRRQKKAPVVDLRRDDVEVLAGFLEEPSEHIVHRLATLMQATQTKRTAMLGVLATGAAVIGLVGTAVAVGGSETSTPDSPIPSDTTTVVVETTVPDTTVETVPTTTVPDTAPDTTPATTVPDTAPSVPTTSEAPPVVSVAPITVPPVTEPPTTTMPPLVDTDLTTTTTIVASGDALVPPGP